MQITEEMLVNAIAADRAQMERFTSAAGMLAGAIKAREVLLVELRKPEKVPLYPPVPVTSPRLPEAKVCGVPGAHSHSWTAEYTPQGTDPFDDYVKAAE